jgi:hypothetical protein
VITIGDTLGEAAYNVFSRTLRFDIGWLQSCAFPHNVGQLLEIGSKNAGFSSAQAIPSSCSISTLRPFRANELGRLAISHEKLEVTVGPHSSLKRRERPGVDAAQIPLKAAVECWVSGLVDRYPDYVPKVSEIVICRDLLVPQALRQQFQK